VSAERFRRGGAGVHCRLAILEQWLSAMEPFFVFFVLPILFGVVAELVWRDARHASLAAGIASTALVYFCLELRDPEGTWNGLATLLIAPLVIAFSLTAVFICYGRIHQRRRRGQRSNGDGPRFWQRGSIPECL
jgi:Na+/proline symporter